MTQPLVPYRASGPTVPDFLADASLGVVQRKEISEFFGFESRNKYSIHASDGREVAFCAEQGKDFFASLARLFMGHWRTFDLHVFDASRRHVLLATHPFRFFFQQLDVTDPNGVPVGSIVRRWGLFTKAFDVTDPSGRVLLEVRSSFWQIWTFRFVRQGRELGTVEKKWSGFFQEAFTDADKFLVKLGAELTPSERALVLMAAIYIDLVYFEKKAEGGFSLSE
jgi:hypothetical protein